MGWWVEASLNWVNSNTPSGAYNKYIVYNNMFTTQVAETYFQIIIQTIYK